MARPALRRVRSSDDAAGNCRAALAKLRVPTLVIHGEDDPLIRIDGGRATAAAIPGALLLTFPGMRHDLPRDLWPTIIDAIRDLSDQAAGATPQASADATDAAR